MSYAQENERVVEEFFEKSKANPWGRLIAVECKPSDLKQWAEGNIPETIKAVVSKPGWETENSFDWAPKGSGNPIFYAFKIYEVWKSIAEIGMKTPLHIHSTANDNGMRFHPSNNKIEIMCEYFPDMPVTVLYHDYDYLRECYPEPILDWYKKFPYRVIKNESQYLDLYGLDQEHNEMEFGWDYCKRIVNSPDEVWGKVKPRAWDWNHIDISEHDGLPSLENALFLTVSDRFHRMAMHHDEIVLGEILQVENGIAKFCGREYEV